MGGYEHIRRAHWPFSKNYFKLVSLISLIAKKKTKNGDEVIISDNFKKIIIITKSKPNIPNLFMIMIA